MTDLDKLEALERAATPGPWENAEALSPDERVVRTVAELDFDKEEGRDFPRQICVAETGEAALIVALRNEAPAMIQELRFLREHKKTVESAQLPYEMAYAERDALREEVEGLKAKLLKRFHASLDADQGYEDAKAEIRELRAQLATAREDFVVVCPCCGESYSAKTTKGGGA